MNDVLEAFIELILVDEIHFLFECGMKVFSPVMVLGNDGV
jgi:hypothetical protein